MANAVHVSSNLRVLDSNDGGLRTYSGVKARPVPGDVAKFLSGYALLSDALPGAAVHSASFEVKEVI